MAHPAPAGVAEPPPLVRGRRDIPSIWRVDGQGVLHLGFHWAQSAAWSAQERIVFLLAGTQSGKTSFLPWWLRREIYGDDRTPGRGPGDYLAVTTSFDLFKLKFLPEMRLVFETILGEGRYWKGDRVIELRDPETQEFWARRSDDPMWGRIILRSAQSEGGLESATANAAVLDEVGQNEFGLDAWEAILARLSLARGRILGATTVYNAGWLKTEVFDRWRAHDPDYRVVQFPSYVNPAFPREEYEAARRRMAPHRFVMRYRGEFGRTPGQIYHLYDEDEVLIDDMVLPRAWPRYVGVDFGGVNVAVLWGALDEESGVLYLYREAMLGDDTTSAYVRAVREASRGERLVHAWGGGPGEDQDRRDWRKAGLRVRKPGIIEVEAGLDRGLELMKTHRLRVFRSLKRWRDEIQRYARVVGDDGEPTDKIANANEFHMMDAFRYLAVGLDTGGGQHFG